MRNASTTFVALPVSAAAALCLAQQEPSPEPAEPFGVISQADVTEFTARFFASDPGVAMLAAPTDLVTQADVSAFVDLFFQGCPAS